MCRDNAQLENCDVNNVNESCVIMFRKSFPCSLVSGAIADVHVRTAEDSSRQLRSSPRKGEAHLSNTHLTIVAHHAISTIETNRFPMADI